MTQGAEYFRQTIIETCNPDDLEKYRNSQRIIQRAIRAHIESSPFGKTDATSGLGFALQQFAELPCSVQDKLDPNNPMIKAAMLIGAVSLRAWVYKSNINGRLNQSYEDVWSQTRLQSLAAKCDEVLFEVVPETHGSFVEINLENMRERHKELKKAGATEHIVATGLNAVGKTTALNEFSKFLVSCDINAKVVKMPRPDGPFSRVILPALAGELKIRKDALQIAFLADAIDFDPEPDSLIVFDRNPLPSEAFVYGPEEIARTVMSAQEIRKQIFQTFILDQHPMSCALKVAERSTAPRIFEDDVEKMTEQLLRFARLTELPGMHWINNDIPRADTSKLVPPERIAVERFIGSVFFSGVLQRYLLKQGIFTNYSKASEFLYAKAIPYMN
jgi:thymidylate kinase